MSETDPRAAALSQTREHGLWGRADSPPDWQAALDGATAGDPVLVKSPDDRRDDFFLVPMRPLHPAARTAWVILDRETLKLREASLLDHWPVPAFPDEKDRSRLSQTPLILPDGTRARFRADDLRPNLKNFVWKPSEAAILPYWPVKEFIAAHPLTREPVSIYLTQDGIILTDLDGENPQSQSTPPKVGNHRVAVIGGIFILSVVLAIAGLQFLPSTSPGKRTPIKEPTPQLETPHVKLPVEATEVSPPHVESDPIKEPTPHLETPHVKLPVKGTEVSPPHVKSDPIKEPTPHLETPRVKLPVKAMEISPTRAGSPPVKGSTRKLETPIVKAPGKPEEISPPRGEPARVKEPTRKLETPFVKPPGKPQETPAPRGEPTRVKEPTRKLEPPKATPNGKPPEASPPDAEPPPSKSSP